ncbi:HNH endonuclease [Nocardia sp. NPDC051981]|uniref:HNH endonuclease n=1 Tax=Nocardia sp. NPDC051981 TaxID=3155417 RepID=UPI0034401465
MTCRSACECRASIDGRAGGAVGPRLDHPRATAIPGRPPDPAVPITQRSTTTRDRHRAVSPLPATMGHLSQRDRLHAAPSRPGRLVVDHIIARSERPDILDNKQAAHRSCNRAKSDRIPDDAGATGPS